MREPRMEEMSRNRLAVQKGTRHTVLEQVRQEREARGGECQRQQAWVEEDAVKGAEYLRQTVVRGRAGCGGGAGCPFWGTQPCLR